MKILIVYSSRTGNTKKLAGGLYDILKDSYDIILKNIKDKPDFENYDIIIPAFWVDKGTADGLSKKFIKHLKDKKIIYIGTIGANPDSEHGQKVTENLPKLLHTSNTHLGTFLANGLVDPKLTARIKFIPLPKKIKDQMYEASVNSRATNDEDIANCTEYVEGIIKALQNE